jgi:hypothetical protein
MKHLIISRVNLEMDLDPWKYKNPKLYALLGWSEYRVLMLNNYARRSLKKQDDQRFQFITLWHEGKIIPGGELPGEVQIEIKRTGTDDDLPLDYKAVNENRAGKCTLNYADQIRDAIRERYDPPVLITNLDCDDALHKKFTQNIRIAFMKYHPTDFYYFDMSVRYIYTRSSGTKGKKVNQSSPSPFVTTYEPKIQCLPLRFNHSLLTKHFNIKGVKLKELSAMQTVNDSNMYSRSSGAPAEFDLKDYI